MDVSWDADNFEPELPTTLATSNKWEGEDEDDEVKESWEDEEEEKKDEEKKDGLAPAAQAKPKKRIQDKIAEKERIAREKAEKLAADKAQEAMTPEQRAAEKLRQQKLQEEYDLRLAMETFGVSEGAGKLDTFNPTTKEEFSEFADLLSKKVNLFKSHEEFPGFVDDLVRNIIVHMPSSDMKRIKITVDNLVIEKQKAEKNDKAKKPTKGKGKAKLKLEGANEHLTQYDGYEGYANDEFDDFM